MAGPPNKGYKRSWKNLLINKRYQLRFTLFMVGLSAILMTGLGVWVMKEANDATTVAKNSIEGTACPKVPVLVPTSGDSGVGMKLEDPNDAGDAGSDAVVAPAPKPVPSSVDPADVAKHGGNDEIIAVENAWCLDAQCKAEKTQPLDVKHPKCDAYVKKKMTDPAAVAALRAALIPVVKCEGGSSFSVAEDAPEPAEHHRHVKVEMEESSMTMVPEPPKAAPEPPIDYGARLAANMTCEINNSAKLAEAEQGRLQILWVLVATGLVLVIGLAVYGIKMTHRVAGPLFKVSLYLAKMRDGRYDKVWNLRKGDQLVEFYEHFKAAHAGVVTAEKGDIDAIKALLASAEKAGVSDNDAVKELTELVARKEKALE
ncbi:MAG: hypothetical protein QM831_39850 [Kofleriaceae bacterium]